MENIKRINKMLKEQLGCALDGRPNYRLTWSTNETEVFRGVISEWYGDIYLGEQFGQQRQRKYPNNPDRWVFEHLVFQPTPELPESQNGNYEPVFVFEDKNGNYLAPEWFAIEWLIHAMRTGRPAGPSYWGALEEAERRKRVEYFYNLLGGDVSSVEERFKFKEAVALPGKEFR